MIDSLLLSPEFFARLFTAAILGGVIGLERIWHGRPAGLRTDMMIALSSCLFTILSLTAFPSDETSRVASQIVVGVGFLGAGTLLHRQDHVMNLTTASAIWLVAAIGMAAGAGQYALAFWVTILALCFLSLLAPFSEWIEAKAEAHRKTQRKPRVMKLHD